ncbi:MATE family efflux transporter [Nemorincola caseinilytica]|uniref:Multidrug-efflux transporter n=1 Tax=Nemorincola caseinilytica TaxID=2054315 RepID=A0ABP8NPF2_9BACT
MNNNEAVKAGKPNYWAIIRSALRGDEYDFTTISLGKAVALLAIPMMLELALESVFAVVDIFFVNKLGVHAVSVVGLTESVITLVYSVGIGLSAAATAMVARRVGEKNTEEAAHAGAQAILLGVISSIVIGIPGYIYAGDILRLMGAEPAAIEQGITYARIMYGFNIAIILLFLINGVFRGAGNASIAMKSLWLGNAFNIVLDPLLIFGIGFFPEFGVTGAAIATTTGRSIGVLYQLYHLWKASGTLKIKAHHFRPSANILKGLIGIASPATFQFIIASASWIFLATMVAEYGSAASAGYQTAIRMVVFFIMPAWGMSNAVATLVGQNLGAQLPDRAEKSVTMTIKYNVIFMACVTVLFLFFAHPLAGMFIPAAQTEQMQYAAQALQIISAGYIFYGIGMVVTQAFNGAGDTRTPTWIYFFGFWVFQIPFAWLLHKYTDIGVTGVFIAVPVAETLMALAVYLFFRMGRWKTVKV